MVTINNLINMDPTTPNFSFTSLLMADDDDDVIMPPPPNPQKTIIPLVETSNSNGNDDYTLESIIENYIERKRKKGPMTATSSPTKKRLGQKACCLRKLLPAGEKVVTSGTRKKSTVEVLDDACKYVKFLQAQVDALKSMPVVGSGGGGGRGWWLSRQKVLQGAVNSPVVQMIMAENGWCVAADEQVELMKKGEARKWRLHHVLANLPV